MLVLFEGCLFIVRIYDITSEERVEFQVSIDGLSNLFL